MYCDDDYHRLSYPAVCKVVQISLSFTSCNINVMLNGQKYSPIQGGDTFVFVKDGNKISSRLHSGSLKDFILRFLRKQTRLDPGPKSGYPPTVYTILTFKPLKILQRTHCGPWNMPTVSMNILWEYCGHASEYTVDLHVHFVAAVLMHSITIHAYAE